MQQQTAKLNKTLFISKSESEVDELLDFCHENKIQLTAESLIRFNSIPFQITKPYDVVFFASIRAAEFFLANEVLDSNKEIACIGQTTAEKLISLGFNLDFIGEKAGKPDEVAKSFKTWLGNRTVLIPQSTISKRSIASRIPEDQLLEVIVYKTVSDCKTIPPCDIYIFTSPSNFESFLSCNASPQGKIIAWGDTTKKCIELHGLTVDITLEKADLKELITVLQK